MATARASGLSLTALGLGLACRERHSASQSSLAWVSVRFAAGKEEKGVALLIPGRDVSRVRNFFQETKALAAMNARKKRNGMSVNASLETKAIQLKHPRHNSKAQDACLSLLCSCSLAIARFQPQNEQYGLDIPQKDRPPGVCVPHLGQEIAAISAL